MDRRVANDSMRLVQPGYDGDPDVITSVFCKWTMECIDGWDRANYYAEAEEQTGRTVAEMIDFCIHAAAFGNIQQAIAGVMISNWRSHSVAGVAKGDDVRTIYPIFYGLPRYGVDAKQLRLNPLQYLRTAISPLPKFSICLCNFAV